MAYYNMQETEKRIKQVREILRAKELDVVLCQEKVQIKRELFS